jgi:hypothetical protein
MEIPVSCSSYTILPTDGGPLTTKMPLPVPHETDRRLFSIASPAARRVCARRLYFGLTNPGERRELPKREPRPALRIAFSHSESTAWPLGECLTSARENGKEAPYSSVRRSPAGKVEYRARAEVEHLLPFLDGVIHRHRV